MSDTFGLLSPNFYIFSFFGAAVLVILKHKTRKYKVSIRELSDKISLLERNGKKKGDFIFAVDSHKTTASKGTIRSLFSTNTLDIYIVKRKAGDKDPKHRHRKSNEVFVLLDGILSVDRVGKDKKIKNTTLVSPYETMHIKPGVDHVCSYGKDCTYLVIGYPPLIKREGKLHEKIRKIFKMSN